MKAFPSLLQDPRGAAWYLVHRVTEEGAWLSRILVAVLQNLPAGPARRRATELAYGTVKWTLYLDWVLQQQVHGGLKRLDSPVRSLLRLGAYQLLKGGVPAYAAVDQTVDLARRGVPQAAGLVNAVLRRLARGAPDPPHPWIAWSVPRWLYQRWQQRWGPEALETWLRYYHSAPPLYLRVNTLQTSREALQAFLQERGVAAEPVDWPPETLRLDRHPWEIPDLPPGWYYVQDRATQALAHLLAPEPGSRIVDLAAAPGGKAAHLAALMQNRGQVIAVDRHRGRVRTLQQVARRLGASIVAPVTADGRAFSLRTPADAVLLDAPCTGLGTLRRKPEILLRLRPERISALARLQQQLLANAARLVRPGGTLLYATCTTEPEENEAQVRRFLRSFRDFQQIPASERVPEDWTVGPFFRSHGPLHDCDEIFGALFRRKSAPVIIGS